MRAMCLLVPHGPEPLSLSGAVEVAPVRLGARDLVDRGPRSSWLPWCTRRMGAGLRSICSIRSASSPACSGWIASCGQTARSASVSARSDMREGTDESPDGEAAGGVLVEVEGGRAVGTRVAAVDPLGEALGDVAVGSRQCSRGGGVAHTRSGTASPPGRGAARGASPRTEARRWRGPSEHRRGTLVTIRKGVDHARGVRRLPSSRPTTWSCSTWTAWSTSGGRPSTGSPRRSTACASPAATSRS